MTLTVCTERESAEEGARYRSYRSWSALGSSCIRIKYLCNLFLFDPVPLCGLPSSIQDTDLITSNDIMTRAAGGHPIAPKACLLAPMPPCRQRPQSAKRHEPTTARPRRDPRLLWAVSPQPHPASACPHPPSGTMMDTASPVSMEDFKFYLDLTCPSY